MSLLSFMKDLDRKFAWSFLGVLLALVFGAITIYKEFVQDQRPALRYDILTSTSVLDVKEEVSNLSVLFEGMDIRKQGLSLRVITIRVLNDSAKDILKGFYDDKAPLGFSISTGKIIRSELAGASNDYLMQNVVLNATDDKSLLFPNVIIEAGQSFSVKLLVLHPNNELPALRVLGKVAGIQSIPVHDISKEQSTESSLKAAFRGSFLVQAARLPAYTFATLVVLFCVIAPIALISTKLVERKRRKHVEAYRAATKRALNVADEYVFSQYIEEGSWVLTFMDLFFSDANRLQAEYDRYHKGASVELPEMMAGHMAHYEDGFPVPIWASASRVRAYIAAGILKETAGTVIPDAHVLDTLRDFIRYLRNRGILSNKRGLPSASAGAADVITGRKKGDVTKG